MSETTSVPALARNALLGRRMGTQQLRPLRDVPADFGRLLVHRVAGGHKRDHAARTHLVEGFGKEVVVNGKTELVISPVIYLILSERDVAHGEVIRTIKKQPFSDTDTMSFSGCSARSA